jgi:hypothetical protein
MCFLCPREEPRNQYLPLEIVTLETLLVSHLQVNHQATLKLHVNHLQVNHQATLKLQINHQATLRLHLSPSGIEKGGSLTYTGG